LTKRTSLPPASLTHLLWAVHTGDVNERFALSRVFLSRAREEAVPDCRGDGENRRSSTGLPTWGRS